MIAKRIGGQWGGVASRLVRTAFERLAWPTGADDAGGLCGSDWIRTCEARSRKLMLIVTWKFPRTFYDLSDPKRSGQYKQSDLCPKN
jgi:hypothetical protein